MTKQRKKGEFDWESIEMVGYGPSYVPIPEGKDARKPRIANKLHVGQFPKNYPLTIFIDGIDISNKSAKFLFKVRDNSIPVSNETFCLIMELDSNTIQFIELDDILDAKGLRALDDWVTKENSTLLKIANEYEQYDRQFYHFMYDIIGIARIVGKWNSQDRESLLKETKTAIGLLHNRSHAEIFSQYSSTGIKITLFPKRVGTKKPDLQIDKTFVDVKAVLLTGRYKHKLLKNFEKRLREDIIEREKTKNQIGECGSFFITVWSGVVSSVFYTVFNKFKNDQVFSGVKLYDSIPPFEEKKVVFVLPSPDAFKNYYLVMDRKRVVRITNFIVKKGYNKIQKYDSMSYLALVNVRKGCSFGLTGNQPMIIFKIT